MEGLIPSDLFLFIGSGKAFYLISLMISPLLKELNRPGYSGDRFV